MAKENGYILFESPNIVIIATMQSDNPKTGNMVQVWILPRDINPVEAVRTGQDDMVCFNCKHRGIWDGSKWVVKRSCYVRVYQAPRSVWECYQNGGYSFLGTDDYKYVFAGRKIRFGAYGEPVLIPLYIMRELSIASDGWTGYTHQWAHAEYATYGAYIMASVDTVEEYRAAKAQGLRTFRCRTADEPLLPNEIMCPASDEAGHKTTCEHCLLCNGSYAGDPRKDIAIVIHGSGAKNFVALTSIGGIQ